MGYQESIIYFHRKNTILNQLKELKKINKSNAFLNAYKVIEVAQSFVSKEGKRFRKGQVYLHIGGERSHQRTIHAVRVGVGIAKAKKIVPVESVADTIDEFESRFKIIKTI